MMKLFTALILVALSLLMFYGTSFAITGDFSEDGYVNFADMSILAEQWLASCPASGNCANADGNGIVNSIDFALLGRNWLQSEATNSSLIGWWEFEQVQNQNTIYDSSSYCRNAIFSNAVLSTDHAVGNSALHFSSNGTCSIDNLNTQSKITIALWVKFDSLSGDYNALLMTNNWLASGTVRLYINSAGQIKFNIYNAGVITSNSSLKAGNWYHVAVTYDKNSGSKGGRAQIFINGNLDKEADLPLTPQKLRFDDVINLGSWKGTQYFLYGSIDDVRIYNEVLTFSQINAIPKLSGNFNINDPSPIDGSTDVSVDTAIWWKTPVDASNGKYTMFIGTSATAVSTATVSNHSNVYVFDCNTSMSVDPFAQLNLAYNLKYYWRVDVNDQSGVLHKGTIWSFTTAAEETGLLGWWKFDSLRNSLTKDSSSKASNGTLTNGPMQVSGISGKAMQFNGQGASIIVPNESYYDFSNIVCLSAWIKTSASGTASQQCIISKGGSYGLYVSKSNGKLIFICQGLSQAAIFSNTSINDNIWHNVAIVLGGGTFQIYIDGILDLSTNLTGTLTQNDTLLCIGARADSSNYAYNGCIDDVRIYNLALTNQNLNVLSGSVYELNLPVTADASINSLYTQTNYGSDETLALVGPAPWTTNALLKFNTSGIGGDKKITSSHLWLYQSAVDYPSRIPTTMSLQICDVPWQEDTATWSSYFGLADPYAYSASNLANGYGMVINTKDFDNNLGWKSWEIVYSQNAKLWQYGLLLIPAQAWNNEPVFNTRENGNGNAPYVQACIADIGAGVVDASGDSTLMQASSADSSMGSAATMNLVTDSASSAAQRPIMKFDLSGITLSADIITTAEVRLYVSASGSGSIDFSVHELTADWQQGSATWASLSSAYNSSPIGYGQFSSTDTGHYVRIKIDPAAVKRWLQNASSNHGIVIRSTSASSSPSFTFKTRESSCAPQLVINTNKQIGITKPVDGQTASYGTKQNITWWTKDYASITHVTLQYSTDDGDSWKMIGAVPNTGSYLWVVPKENSNKCRIKATSQDDAAITDITTQFSIYEPLVHIDPVLKGAGAQSEETGNGIYRLDSARRSWIASDTFTAVIDGKSFSQGSISFWVNAIAGLPSSTQNLITAKDPNDTIIASITLDQTGKIVANHKYNGYWLLGVSSSAGAVTPGAWNHIVYSYGTSGQKLFVNGTQVSVQQYERSPLNWLYQIEILPLNPSVMSYAELNINANQINSVTLSGTPVTDSYLTPTIATLLDIQRNQSLRNQQVSQLEESLDTTLTYERAQLKIINSFTSNLLLWTIRGHVVSPTMAALDAVQVQDVNWITQTITSWDARIAGLSNGTIQPRTSKTIIPDRATISFSDGTFVQQGAPIFITGTWYGRYDLIDGLGFSLLGGMISTGDCMPTETSSPSDAAGIQQRDSANTAYQHGYFWDVLFSCASPDWLKNTYPELNVGYNSALAYDAVTQDRQGWSLNQTTLNTNIPVIAQSPGFLTFDLMNEPAFNGYTVECQSEWRSWLQTKHGTISALNNAWGTGYSGFSSIEVPGFVFSGVIWGPPAQEFPTDDSTLRKYVDWCQFNCNRVTNFFGRMRDIIHGIAPNVYTHIKMLPGPATGMDAGIDIISNVRRMDVASSDGWWLYKYNNGNPNWIKYSVTDWDTLMFYDLLRSARADSPIINSETHFFGGEIPVLDANMQLHVASDNWIMPIPAEHFYSGLWQESIHGLGLSILWQNWPSNNIDQRAVALDATSRAALDLNRLAGYVKALQKAPRKVGLLYSNSSLLWDTSGQWTANAHWDGMFPVYESLALNGIPIKFVIESDLVQGVIPDVNVLIVQHSPNIDAAAIATLKLAVTSGMEIWTVGSNGDLQRNPYNWPQTVSLPTIAQNIPQSLFTADSIGTMRTYLANKGLLPDISLMENGAAITNRVVIIDDNFNGTAGSSINSTYWVAAAGNTLNGDGTAHIANVTSGVGTGILYAAPSTYTMPTENQFVQATYYVSSAAWNSGYSLYGGSSAASISMIDDRGDDMWHVQINGKDFNTSVSRNWNWGGATTDIIQMRWYTDRVVISLNGVQIFDSSVNGSGWTLPTVPCGAVLGAGYSVWDVDRVVVEMVPLAAQTIDYRVITYNGKTVINLCNYGLKAKHIAIRSRSGLDLPSTVIDLIPTETLNTNGFDVAPEQVRLIEMSMP
jgi:hypothetical protein